MKPIYDGFLPTSTGATIRQIDVPMIQVPTMTEVMSGTATARQDGDEPGDQFRVYEFAGHGAHRFARRRGLLPESVQAADQPLPAGGVHVGRAQSPLAVGGQGHGAAAGRPHPRGSQRRQRRVGDGARRTRQRHAAASATRTWTSRRRNTACATKARFRRFQNAHPFVAVRGEAAQNQLCGLAGYEMALLAGGA